MIDSANIKAQLQACRSKEETFKTLVSLSHLLPRLSAEDKIEKNKVRGCESAVWLIIEDDNGLCHIKADSDAKLMRGVLTAIVSLVDGKTAQEIQRMNVNAELVDLNLTHYLTSSRTNGVLAILKQLQR
jgi:cysteine desulfuration protein SufE